MKSLYIQPVVEFEKIDTTDVLAGSGNVVVNDFDDKKDQDGIDTNLEGGDGKDFRAKQDFEFYVDCDPW